jgi:hypothetical protein
VRADIVDRRDVGMVENSCRARLLLKAPQTIRVLGERRRKNFDRDLSA